MHTSLFRIERRQQVLSWSCSASRDLKSWKSWASEGMSVLVSARGGRSSCFSTDACVALLCPRAQKGGKPFRAEVGDMVRGVVAEEQEPQRAIAVDLYPLLPSSDGAEGQEASRDDEAEPSQEHATKTKRGYLMLEHVGDNVSVCRSSLRSALKPGTQLSRLLVYGASRTGAPLVTMKPLLLFAASHRPSRKVCRRIPLPKLTSSSSSKAVLDV